MFRTKYVNHGRLDIVFVCGSALQRGRIVTSLMTSLGGVFLLPNLGDLAHHFVDGRRLAHQ